MDPISFQPSSQGHGQGPRSGAVALTVQQSLKWLACQHFCDGSPAHIGHDVVYIVGPCKNSQHIRDLVDYYTRDQERFLVRRHEGLGWEIRRLFNYWERLDVLEQGDIPIPLPPLKDA